MCEATAARKILIDADGCPVVDLTIKIAQRHKVECWILCDSAHFFERPGARTITFATAADSVDFALVNRANKGDIVITQDYGLAAMCLARKAIVLSQNGLQYSAENIDDLLLRRHIAKQVRRAGGRLKGPPKRTAAEDQAFAALLEQVLSATPAE